VIRLFHEGRDLIDSRAATNRIGCPVAEDSNRIPTGAGIHIVSSQTDARDIAACPAFDSVRSGPIDKSVSPSSTVKTVRPPSANEPILAEPTKHVISTSSSHQVIISSPALSDFGAVPGVASRAKRDHVIARSGLDEVDPGERTDPVGTVGSRDDVIPGGADRLRTSECCLT
jgi:hypothetical protein